MGRGGTQKIKCIHKLFRPSSLFFNVVMLEPDTSLKFKFTLTENMQGDLILDPLPPLPPTGTTVP